MNFVTARHNPFATDRLDTVPFRFSLGDWEENLQRLAKLNYRAAIVGQRGSGKSTLLRELVKQLPKVGQPVSYLNLPLEKTAHGKLLAAGLASAFRGAVLLVDGMERLSLVNRFRIMRETKYLPGLVATQHRTGRLPTWIHCQTSVTLLREILQDLQLSQPEIIAAGEQAFLRARGNLRDTLRELYDLYARGEFSSVTDRSSSGCHRYPRGESSNV